MTMVIVERSLKRDAALLVSFFFFFFFSFFYRNRAVCLYLLGFSRFLASSRMFIFSFPSLLCEFPESSLNTTIILKSRAIAALPAATATATA